MALQLIDFIGTHFQKNRLLTQSGAWLGEEFRTNTHPTSSCWPQATRHPDSAPDFAATHDTHVVPAPIMCLPRHMAISWYSPGILRSTAAWIVSILNCICVHD